jgi:hypothetical protein
MCPSREHIPVSIHMALDNGKGEFEELLKTFEECRQPNWGLQRSSSARRDLRFSSSILGGFAAQHTGAVHWR